MNVYRNKKTGVLIEIPSEFGNNEVWELVTPAPVAKAGKAEPEEEKPKKTAPKKATTTKKAVKK